MRNIQIKPATQTKSSITNVDLTRMCTSRRSLATPQKFPRLNKMLKGLVSMNLPDAGMVRQRSLVSAAWEYFKVVDGGAQCQIDGCTHSFLKRASGSSTKFLWSHLDAHHRELARELGRLGKKRTRKSPKKPMIGGSSETVDIHCYPCGSSQIPPSFVYTQSSIPSSSNTMNMNLMDLIQGPESTNNLNTSLNDTQPVLSINEYFCKMLCAQLNQMSDKQAHLAREKIHSVVGQVLFNEQRTQQSKLQLHQQFGQQSYS